MFRIFNALPRARGPPKGGTASHGPCPSPLTSAPDRSPSTGGPGRWPATGGAWGWDPSAARDRWTPGSPRNNQIVLGKRTIKNTYCSGKIVLIAIISCAAESSAVIFLLHMSDHIYNDHT